MAKSTSFEDFLSEEGILEEVDEIAVKRVIAWQIEQKMKELGIKKSELAQRMHTSRVQVDRLLAPENPSVTLHTMFKAAAALGQRLRITLEDRVPA
jgi:hypothetical protein